MNMNATLFPCNGSCMTELPYNLLNGWDVCIFTDRGYKLYLVLIPGMGFVLFLCHNTGIIHDLPLPPLIVIDTVFLIISTIILTTASQIFCYNLRRFLSGQTGQLNFNAEFKQPDIDGRKVSGGLELGMERRGGRRGGGGGGSDV